MKHKFDPTRSKHLHRPVAEPKTLPTQSSSQIVYCGNGRTDNSSKCIPFRLQRKRDAKIPKVTLWLIDVYLHDPVWNAYHRIASNFPATHRTVTPQSDLCECHHLDRVAFFQRRTQRLAIWIRDCTESRTWELEIFQQKNDASSNFVLCQYCVRNTYTDWMQRIRCMISGRRCQNAWVANRTLETYLRIPFRKRTSRPSCNLRTWTHFFWNGRLTP